MSEKHGFTHLHVHTDASRIDGLGAVGRIVSGAKGLGFTALAMTDHGTLANAISFTVACEQQDVKPIIGMEGYVRHDGKRFHITLLADGQAGFDTLARLNNLGQTGTDPTRPSFGFEDLLKDNEGLVILTGCSASPFQHDVEWADARNLALRLKSVVGPRLMAEVMFVGSSGSHWERAAKLSKDLRLPPVVTNDVHFTYPQDAPVQQLLTTLKSGFTYENRHLFLATSEDLRQRVESLAPEHLPLLESGMRNAAVLSNRLSSVHFKAPATLPEIPNADAELRALVIAGLSRKAPEESKAKYSARAADELHVIESMGFSSYFLILHDIIRYARSIDVRVGPGRGSGAGSLVLWAIGCTEIDPMVYGLSFDRFLNRQRKEMPDVDTDFDSEGRDAVIAYATRRWGAIAVATYLKWQHKSLIHDLARTLRIPRGMDEEMADEGPYGPAFKRASSRYDLLEPAYAAMNGQIKSIGKHPGGIVIPPPERLIPLERTTDGTVVAAWTEGEYRELSHAGIVKFDLLGISALTILKQLEEKFGRRAPDPVDYSPVFRLFADGDTSGIFQFHGSSGIIRFTQSVEPQTFNDLVAINALWRPGAIDAGTAQLYPVWRKSPRKIHPLIDDILDETYGIICYQEQFMQIYARLTDKTMAEADLARKVLSKARPGQPEWEADHAKLRYDFISAGEKKGLTKDQTERLWSEIDKHSRYSFNKSHSVAYARIAWELAWWKWFHRPDFYTAYMNTDEGQWQNIIHEAVMGGMTIKMPHVNRSTERFETDGKVIYLPLTVIKGMGANRAKEIVSARPYSSIGDFLARVPRRAVNATMRRALVELNAFEGLDGEMTEADMTTSTGTVFDGSDPQKYLSIFLPSPDFVKRIREAEEAGYVAGRVSSVEERESKYGKYFVVQLLPAGSYWTRNFRLSVGDEVRLQVKADSGKILSVTSL